MNVHSTQTPNQTSGMRLLTDAELNDVNGGFLVELISLLIGAGIICYAVFVTDWTGFTGGAPWGNEYPGPM